MMPYKNTPNPSRPAQSPRKGASPHCSGDVRNAIERERKERTLDSERLTMKIKTQDDDISSLSRKLEAMQLTIADFQVVLTSHEREVEGLWARIGVKAKPDDTALPPPPGIPPQDVAEIHRQLHALADRVEAAEARALAGTRAADNLQASTMELLFSQNREFMDELESKLKLTQEGSARDIDRLSSQIAVLREALQMGDRQQDAGLRGSEARMARALDGVRNEVNSLWESLVNCLNNPSIPPSLSDPNIVMKVSSLRDGIMAAISNKVSSAMDSLRRESEDRGRHYDTTMRKMQSTVHQDHVMMEQLAAEMQNLAARPSTATLEHLDSLRAGLEHQISELTTKLNSQQLAVVDIDRRVDNKIAALEDAFGNFEDLLSKNTPDQKAFNSLLAQVNGLREELTRHHGEAMAFQDQFNDILQRSIGDVRGQLLQQQETVREHLQMAVEKAANATRQCDSLHHQVEEQAGAVKRLVSQVAENESQRKDDHRRLQQQTTDSCVRVQQVVSADIHRLQKEFAQEMQRYEDQASSLYRMMEELRGVQQRTLDEYHRQGDTHAMALAKLQEQMAEHYGMLKDSIQTESDRWQTALRTEVQALSDQAARLRMEIGERVGTTERRIQDLEAAGDTFRNRLRAIEMQVGSQQPKTLEDLKSRVQHTESRLDAWRTDMQDRIGDLEDRIAGAGNAAQIQMLLRRCDELERGMRSERDEMRRITRDAVDKAVGELDRNMDDKMSQVGRHENVIKEIQREVNRIDGSMRGLDKIKKQLDELAATVEGLMNMDLRDIVEQRIGEITSTLDSQGKKQRQLEEMLKSNLTTQLQTLRAELKQVEGMLNDAVKQSEARMMQAIEDNSKEDESRERKLMEMQAKLEENFREDEEREMRISKQHEEIALVYQKMEDARMAMDEKVDNFHSGMAIIQKDLEDRVRDAEDFFINQRDQVSQLEKHISILKGYVKEMSAEKDHIQRLATRVEELDQKVDTELQKARRTMELANMESGRKASYPQTPK
eukprot:Sspe_Gene.51556::Locus_28623_Transcript_1_1_Confidence_1.000_Length_3101::g.51556::m.51556